MGDKKMLQILPEIEEGEDQTDNVIAKLWPRVKIHSCQEGPHACGLIRPIAWNRVEKVYIIILKKKKKKKIKIKIKIKFFFSNPSTRHEEVKEPNLSCLHHPDLS